MKLLVLILNALIKFNTNSFITWLVEGDSFLPNYMPENFDPYALGGYIKVQGNSAPHFSAEAKTLLAGFFDWSLRNWNRGVGLFPRNDWQFCAAGRAGWLGNYSMGGDNTWYSAQTTKAGATDRGWQYKLDGTSPNAVYGVGIKLLETSAQWLVHSRSGTFAIRGTNDTTIDALLAPLHLSIAPSGGIT